MRVFVGLNAKGNPVQKSKTFHGGKRAAQSALAAFVTDVETNGLPDDQDKVTVAQLLERWMEHIGPERTGYTMKGYRSKIRARLGPAFGDTLLAKLNGEQLDRQYRAWLAEGLSPTTVHQCHAILSAALHQAAKWSWIERNPAERATAPGVRRGTAESIPPDDMRALIAAAVDDGVLATAILLAASTGCRRGELCDLRWSDVDEDGASLSVARSLTVIEREHTHGETKTHQTRRLSLDPLAVAVLSARRLTQAEQAENAGVTLAPDPFVLSRDADGARPCLPDGITHGFTRLCGRLGMRYHFHQCRHFTATTAIGAGVDIRTVAARLGHADASITLRVYAHALKAQDQRAAEAIGDALRPRVEPV